MWSHRSTTQVVYDGKGTHLKLKRPVALDQKQWRQIVTCVLLCSIRLGIVATAVMQSHASIVLMEQWLICQTTEAATHSGKSLSSLFRSIAKIARKWRNLQIISMSQEWRWKCCNLSGGVALIVWFTTNGMCVKNNTIRYVARASNSKRDCGWRELGWHTVINYNQET